MEDNNYRHLYNLPKQLNQKQLYCAPYGTQKSFNGCAIFSPAQKFRVVQNRKGHRRANNLTYVLFYRQNEIMIRIDINGQKHKGIETPHAHIFDNKHNNGKSAIPLRELKNYNLTDDIVKSFF